MTPFPWMLADVSRDICCLGTMISATAIGNHIPSRVSYIDGQEVLRLRGRCLDEVQARIGLAQLQAILLDLGEGRSLQRLWVQFGLGERVVAV